MVMKMVWGMYEINNHQTGGNRDMGGRRRGLNRRVTRKTLGRVSQELWDLTNATSSVG